MNIAFFYLLKEKKTFRSDEFSLYFSLIIGCVDSLCICFCKTEWLQWKFQFIMDEMFSCSRERTCDALNEYYDFISFFFCLFHIEYLSVRSFDADFCIDISKIIFAGVSHLWKTSFLFGEKKKNRLLFFIHSLCFSFSFVPKI